MFGDTWVSDCRREGKHSRDTGSREEEEKEKEEEEDGRQADADEAIYSCTEGGRVSRARWLDECV